jgi:uncharacterized protein (TIGR02145 family)
MKKLMKISVLVLFVILVINGCNKDDDTPDTPNPYNGKTTAVFNPDKTYGTLTDQDGNIYRTITIGTQTWMAENLRTTKYRDGTAIPNVTDNTAWSNLSTGAYCNYNNTESADTIATYGRLYNWYAATDSRDIAPSGWHVPTDDEWTTLTTYLGGDSVAGGKMKETGTTHWVTPNGGATNESGFTALPSGVRIDYINDSKFKWVGSYGIYMSSTFDNILLDMRPPLVSYWEAYAVHSGGDKDTGFAVRLVKD